MVIMGIVLVLMETIMCLLVCDGFYWWDVKSYWTNAQNTLQKAILLEKYNVHNNILMETIVISVMVCIGLLLFVCLSRESL